MRSFVRHARRTLRYTIKTDVLPQATTAETAATNPTIVTSFGPEHLLVGSERHLTRLEELVGAHDEAFSSNAAARELTGAAKFAALAAGQAVAVAHVAAHQLGASAYAIRPAEAAAPVDEAQTARRRERAWQRDQLPDDIRALVLEDQKNRNSICWFVSRTLKISRVRHPA